MEKLPPRVRNALAARPLLRSFSLAKALPGKKHRVTIPDRVGAHWLSALPTA